MKESGADGGGGGKSGSWLGMLLLFLVGLIFVGGFAYPLLKSRGRSLPADDVHDVILGQLSRMERDLKRLDRIEGRLTLLEERQAQQAAEQDRPGPGNTRRRR